MKCYYVGLCGKAGSGKGLVASQMKTMCIPDIVQTFPMAEDLKDIATTHFGWDGIKDTKGRRLLQLLGTDCGRMYGGDDFWVNKWKTKVELFTQNNNNTCWIICDDVRFDNEAKCIRNMGGTIIKIIGRQYNMNVSESTHASEQGICDDLIDVYLHNTGTEVELYHNVKKHILERIINK